MKLFRPTADFLREGDTLNFFPANDDVVGFFEIYALVAYRGCLKEAVLFALAWAVNPSGKRAIITNTIPILLSISVAKISHKRHKIHELSSLLSFLCLFVATSPFPSLSWSAITDLLLCCSIHLFD